MKTSTILYSFLFISILCLVGTASAQDLETTSLIISGDSISIFNVNFGTDDPTYSKIIKYGTVKSCSIDDVDSSCVTTDNKIIIIVKPSLRGIYNHQTMYVKLTELDNTVKDIPIEIVTIDVMGWFGVSPTKIEAAPFFMFEKDVVTGDVIGVRLWWIVGLIMVGLIYNRRKK